MSVAVQCYSCGQRFAAAAHLYGTQVACSNCGSGIQIPPGPPAAPLTAIPETPPSPDYPTAAQGPRSLSALSQSRRPAANGGSAATLIGLFVGGGCLLLLAVGVGSLMWFATGESQREVAAPESEAAPPEPAAPAGASPDNGAGGHQPAEQIEQPHNAGAAHPQGKRVAVEPAPAKNEPPPAADRAEVAPVAAAPDAMGPEDPVTSARRVRQCWDTYAAAIRGADGETALDCIDEQSVNWYGTARELAIAGKRRDLSSRSPSVKLMVLTLRLHMSLEQLQGMTGEDVFKHGVVQQWVGRSGKTINIVDVQVEGNIAQLIARTESGRSAIAIPFYRDAGGWKLNLVSLLNLPNQLVRLGSMLGSKSEESLIVEAMEKELGRKLPANIWDPLDPNKTMNDFARARAEANRYVPEVVPESRRLDEIEVVSSIPTDFGANFMFASAPHPFVLVEDAVWDLRSGEKVGTLPFEFDGSNRWALSSSGNFVAKGDSVSKTDQPSMIDVFDVRTGQLAYQHTLSKRQGRNRDREPVIYAINYLHFLDDTRLLSGWYDEVESWNLSEERAEKRFVISGNEDWKISSDHKFLAIVDADEFVIYDISKGRAVARMEKPSSRGLPFGALWGLAFSPDTQEVAALMRPARLIVWSNEGKIVLDQKLPERIQWTWSDNRENLVWFPDKSGWFIAGRFVVQREPLQVLWEVRSEKLAKRKPGQLLGNQHVALARGSVRDSEIVAIKIPWERIRRASAAELPLVTDISKHPQPTQ